MLYFIKLTQRLSTEQLSMVQERLRRDFPEHKFLIGDAGVESVTPVGALSREGTRRAFAWAIEQLRERASIETVVDLLLDQFMLVPRSLNPLSLSVAWSDEENARIAAEMAKKAEWNE